MTLNGQQSGYDVFISHSAKDREFATRFAEDLDKAGLRVWLDLWHIKPGDSFVGAIEQAMKASRFLLIVMSPDYFQSAWTNQEWQYTLAQELAGSGIRLIPILLRDCEIPAILRTKQWVDFRDRAQYRLVLDGLVRDLRSLASGRSPLRQATEAPKPGERVEQLDPKVLSDLRKSLQDAVDVFRAKPDTPPVLPSQTELADMEQALCFVVMPFGVASLDIVYDDFVRSTLTNQCQLRPVRGDDVFGSNVIMEDITKRIRRARLIIADLTGRNPNVFYEVGIAHALNKQVLLMTQSIDDVPFDLRHRRALVYEYSPRGCKKLEKDLYDNVQSILLHDHGS